MAAAQAAVPPTMTGAQRRLHFRVPAPGSGALRATLHDQSGHRIGAIVLDLSRAGLGAQVPPTTLVERGLRLRCELRFDDGPLQTEAVVRHCEPARAALRIGLEFTALEPAQASRVGRAVAGLQRLLLRRAAGDG